MTPLEPPLPATDAPATRRARRAVAVMFAVHGTASGSLATRIPWLAEQLGLGEGQLGLALIMPALGSLVTMPFTGSLVLAVGGRKATRTLIGFWTLTLSIVATATDRWTLMALLLLAGIAMGTSDVAMNAEAVAVERVLGRTVMSGFHGMWSIGGMLGGGIGVVAGLAHVSAPIHLALVGGGLFAVSVVTGHWLLNAVPQDLAGTGSRFSYPRGPVLVVALIGFCAVFVEGATADWAAVYLRRQLSAGEGQAAAGYTLFAMAMAAGRLGGDAMVRRLGAVTTVRRMAALGIAGGLLVVFARNPIPAIAGFGLIGLGVAVVVPLGFSAAGRTGRVCAGETAAHSIASVATVAYGAGLAAPGLMGGIAELTSLPFSFLMVTGLIVVVLAGAPRLGRAEPCTDEAA